jgi:hypothetical protein
MLHVMRCCVHSRDVIRPPVMPHTSTAVMCTESASMLAVGLKMAILCQG